LAVEVERRGHVAIVTMNRPEALNSLDSAQLRDLIDVFRTIAVDSGTRSVVLTGAGEHAFAAGADIKEMANLDRIEAMAFARLGHAAARSIEELPQPVIASVNGYALGGGCELALACDIRIASESAVFGQPEVSLGIPPGWGGSQRLARQVGTGLASEMILAGRRVSADEALRLGLVSAVYPAGVVINEAVRMAEQISANSPVAVRTAKQLMRLAFNEQPVLGLDTEARAFGESFGSADQREGMQAFLEKRAPVFEDPI
jgi:enoyl-CoA hydratase